VYTGLRLKMGKLSLDLDIRFQTDFIHLHRNVALYKGSDLRWNTATSCQATCSLKFQDDGNLVLYNSNSAIWNTGTFGSSAGMIFAVSDYGFLQVLDKEFNTQWSSQGLAIPLSSVMSSANKPADWTLTSSNEKFSLQLQKDG